MSANAQNSLARVFNRFMVFYNFIFVLALLLFMLKDPNAPLNFMMFILLFPVLVIFSHYAWNQLVKLRLKDRKNWYFSWRAFFTQDSLLFFATLALFVLAINLALTNRAHSFTDLVFTSTKVIQNANATKGTP